MFLGGSGNRWPFKRIQLKIERELSQLATGSLSPSSSPLVFLPLGSANTPTIQLTRAQHSPETQLSRLSTSVDHALGVLLNSLLSLACRLCFPLWVRSALKNIATCTGQRHRGARQCVGNRMSASTWWHLGLPPLPYSLPQLRSLDPGSLCVRTRELARF